MFEDIIGKHNIIDTKKLAGQISITSSEFIYKANDPRYEIIDEDDIEKSLNKLLHVHPEIEQIFPIKLYNSISLYYDKDLSRKDQKKKVNFDKIMKFEYPYLLGGKLDDFNIFRLDENLIFVYISYMVEDIVDDMWVCKINYTNERLYPHQSFLVGG